MPRTRKPSAEGNWLYRCPDCQRCWSRIESAAVVVGGSEKAIVVQCWECWQRTAAIIDERRAARAAGGGPAGNPVE